MVARRQAKETNEFVGPNLGLKHLWVLNLLSRYGDRALSLDEVARGVNIKASSIRPALDDLCQLGMVKRRNGRGEVRFALNPANPWTRQARTVLNLVYLDPLLDDLSSISHKIVLFGEAAYGGDGDQAIDLFIVTTRTNRTKVLQALAASELNGRLRPTVVDGDELAGLPRRNRMLHEQVSRGVVLWER
ncbi:MAG: hypothetical protein KKA73_28460 [Chloroflexi bacterium]|nr:hypothetical protein [Chloroflexota bacterium]MBU1751627.1 hypothetical protein [Chloroflexota bacterium]